MRVYIHAMRLLRPDTTRRSAPLLRAAVALLCLGGLATPALAQVEDSPSQYWTLEKQRLDRMRESQTPRIQQRPTHLIRRAAPVKGFARTVPGTTPETPAPGAAPVDPTAPDASPAGDTPVAPAPDRPIEATAPPAAVPDTTPAPAPSAQAPIRAEKASVAVLGDSLGQLLGVGLTESFSDRTDIALLRKAKENSGLVRDDYYDWQKAARDLLDGREKVDLAIMMIGSNDRQQLREGGQNYDARSPRWKEIYTARARTLATMFRDKKVPLIWVGLPVMNSERLNTDILEFNEIYKTVAAEAGATYVDIWEAFADDRGQFSTYGPDVNGQMARLRSGDGIHFTKAGARKLAHFVEGDIRRVLEGLKPPVDPAAAVAAIATTPTETPALDRPALAPVTPEQPPEVSATPRAEPAAPTPPPPVLRPAAGPVVPLTAPPLSPGGRLASATTRAGRLGDAEAAHVVEEGLVQGKPLDARPGRADDFAWPRP